MPGVSLCTISSQHCRRNSRSRPPWIMQNKFCFSGYLCATIHRSSQRTDRSIASCIRARSGDVVWMTSSNCIMMSDPIEFCRAMECSGVSNLNPCQLIPIKNGRQRVHRTPIMRTQKPHTLLRDLCQLEQRDHLKTFGGNQFTHHYLCPVRRRLTRHCQSRYCSSTLVTCERRRSCPARPVPVLSPSGTCCSGRACIPSLRVVPVSDPSGTPASRRA